MGEAGFRGFDPLNFPLQALHGLAQVIGQNPYGAGTHQQNAADIDHPPEPHGVRHKMLPAEQRRTGDERNRGQHKQQQGHKQPQARDHAGDDQDHRIPQQGTAIQALTDPQ